MQSTPLTYTHTLGIFAIAVEEPLTGGEVANKMHQYEDGPSSPLQACISGVEKLCDKLSKRENRSYSPPAQGQGTAIRRRCASAGPT